MSNSHSDFVHSDFKTKESLIKFHEYETSLARLNYTRSSLVLQKEDDGYAIKQEMSYRNDSEEERGLMTRIKYYNDDSIDVDFTPANKTHYYYHSIEEDLLKFLPQSIHIYTANNKRYAVYEMDEDVRRVHYDVSNVWELQKDRITFKPDGTIDGGKKCTRGESKFADDKPLKEHLTAKHFTEMTKARLDGDFKVEWGQLNATFRGVDTRKFHFVVELFRPKVAKRYGTGPNSGVIRKLSVARFVSDIKDIQQAERLALSIIKDLPDSCLGYHMSKLRSKYKNAN